MWWVVVQAAVSVVRYGLSASTSHRYEKVWVAAVLRMSVRSVAVEMSHRRTGIWGSVGWVTAVCMHVKSVECMSEIQAPELYLGRGLLGQVWVRRLWVEWWGLIDRRWARVRWGRFRRLSASMDWIVLSIWVRGDLGLLGRGGHGN